MEGVVRSGRARLAQPVSLLLVSLVFSVMSSALAAQTGVLASKVNRTAPNFSRVDLSHIKIELRSFRGKVVLLNFWATWCAPRLTEIPTFTEWQKQYGAGSSK
jgi:thiol-disulfide isomerase/thioredoxin